MEEDQNITYTLLIVNESNYHPAHFSVACEIVTDCLAFSSDPSIVDSDYIYQMLREHDDEDEARIDDTLELLQDVNVVRSALMEIVEFNSSIIDMGVNNIRDAYIVAQSNDKTLISIECAKGQSIWNDPMIRYQ